MASVRLSKLEPQAVRDLRRNKYAETLLALHGWECSSQLLQERTACGFEALDTNRGADDFPAKEQLRRSLQQHDVATRQTRDDSVRSLRSVYVLLNERGAGGLQQLTFGRQIGTRQPHRDKRVGRIRMREMFRSIGRRMIAAAKENVGELQFLQRAGQRVGAFREQRKEGGRISLLEMMSISSRQRIPRLWRRDELDFGPIGELRVLISDSVGMPCSGLQRKSDVTIACRRGIKVGDRNVDVIKSIDSRRVLRVQCCRQPQN